ncbi:AraC family transcriptional regulator [Thalassospira sp. TSL5-1]|uniref:helix-turn-helix transcriptional regulator n=1 Tax=Thalassospira sp. TSL5-1 TaxID=1544451 RepID=UPI00093B052B|nr:AraC family transcriptional regulator [Thalassospira sp. TSL5-1]
MRIIQERITNPEGYSWGYFHYVWDDFRCNWHQHPEYELTLTLNAKGSRLIGDHRQSFDGVDFAMVGPNLPHLWECQRISAEKQIEVYVLWLSQEWVENLTRDFVEFADLYALFEQARRGLSFTPEAVQKVLEIAPELDDAAPRKRFMLIIEILEILLNGIDGPLASASFGNDTQGNSDSLRVDRAIAFIHAHHAEPLRVSTLANVAGVSESSFYRLFKRYTGRSVVEYLNEYRISRACVQLSRTDWPIYRIAEFNGFSNLSNFNRRFRQYRGKSARDYRDNIRIHGQFPDYPPMPDARIGAVPARPLPSETDGVSTGRCVGLKGIPAEVI